MAASDGVVRMRLLPHEVVSEGGAVRLTSQLRRASISVASNIAEGRGRATTGEFKQFLCIAQGSTYEVHTQLLLAKRLNIGDEEMLRSAEAFCIETSKMLGALIASLAKKS